jgi:hypothetical protein
MKSLYEVLNVDLAQAYTKERKKATIAKLADELGNELEAEANAAIDAMDIPDSDERYHWIQVIAARAAADLLTIGKVQPENMMMMASLPNEDFKECVKVATTRARSLNDDTISAEKSLNTDTISEAIV